MAHLWLDLKGPILADTVYINGVLVAKDVTITLPAVTHVTADYKAMGTYTAPMTGQIEGMEAAITKIGIDKGLRSMVQLESKTLEVRWAQDVKYADGSTKTEGCKAFMRCVPKLIPGLSVDPGNPSENEVTLAVSRYQVFVAGEVFCLIDQLNTIMRIGGVDELLYAGFGSRHVGFCGLQRRFVRHLIYDEKGLAFRNGLTLVYAEFEDGSRNLRIDGDVLTSADGRRVVDRDFAVGSGYGHHGVFRGAHCRRCLSARNGCHEAGHDGCFHKCLLHNSPLF